MCVLQGLPSTWPHSAPSHHSCGAAEHRVTRARWGQARLQRATTAQLVCSPSALPAGCSRNSFHCARSEMVQVCTWPRGTERPCSPCCKPLRCPHHHLPARWSLNAAGGAHTHQSCPHVDGRLLVTHPDLNKSVLCRSLGAGRDGGASLEDAAAGHSSAPLPEPRCVPCALFCDSLTLNRSRRRRFCVSESICACYSLSLWARAPGMAPADGGDLPKRGENAEKFLLLCSTHQPGPQLQNSNSICLQSRSSFQG